jgi:dolichyl-phosphate-mannose--protein O-mannosyl transferase
VLLLALTVRASHLGAFAALVALGFVIGIAGHIVRSRTMVITGILVIGMVTAYYALVLEPAR